MRIRIRIRIRNPGCVGSGSKIQDLQSAPLIIVIRDRGKSFRIIVTMKKNKTYRAQLNIKENFK
jgi:hypothetical protein